MAKSASSLVTSCLFAGYLFSTLLHGSQVVECASILDDTCSHDVLRSSLEQAAKQSNENGKNASQVAGELFIKCYEGFLVENSIDPSVKETVDSWIGSDISKVDPDQLFMAYQLALMNNKLEDPSEEFSSECNKMQQNYENFRENISPLSDYIDSSDLMLLGESNSGRELLNYALYAEFCASMLD